MNISLTDELKDFVQKKIENGQYPSETTDKCKLPQAKA
jgi:Arc/MetJ-type ribon-helix-helix transcriptional regulator